MDNKKERYYFSHDYNARNDDKIEAMISDHGAAGYGLYWCMVERLHEENNRIELSENFYKAIAKQMLSNAEQVKKFVNDCCTMYGLFECDEQTLSAKRVADNLNRRDEISQKRRLAGKLGANAKQMLANAKQNQAKERKGKEKKGKEIEIHNATHTGASAPTIADRSAKFYNSAMVYIPEYGSDLVEKFCQYWTEPNRSGNKLRFEDEKFFDFKRRLNTWRSRNKPSGQFSLNGHIENKYKVQ